MTPGIKKALERLRQINAESTRVGHILAAKNAMLEAALALGDGKEVETARQELLAAFEASVDFKVRISREADSLQNLVDRDY